MCEEDPAWIEVRWSKIWLKIQSHMTSHYTWGPMTTLHDFGSVLEQPLDISFGSYNSIVMALGLCVALTVPLGATIATTFTYDLWLHKTKIQELRATSQTSQEPWPCNGEDPWLSSKGRTMGVGKATLGSHGTSSITSVKWEWTIYYIARATCAKTKRFKLEFFVNSQ